MTDIKFDTIIIIIIFISEKKYIIILSEHPAETLFTDREVSALKTQIINQGNFHINGGLAQMVERPLSMREVPGSMPGSSRFLLLSLK